MTDDILNDPEFKAWAKRVTNELVPKLEGSACTISLVPEGPADVKFAVELGLSIMMDKPIVLVVSPGTQLPAKLVKIADEIVEFDWRKGSDVAGALRIGEAITRVTGREVGKE